jgi:hypothetical protein
MRADVAEGLPPKAPSNELNEWMYLSFHACVCWLRKPRK